MPEPELPRWRSGVLLTCLFLVAVLVVAGLELPSLTRAVSGVRSAWRAVPAVVQSVSISSRSAHSSGGRGSVPGYVLKYAVTARVKYEVDGTSYDTVAAGWEQRFLATARWEQSGLEAGQTVPIRVRPDAPDHATLLGAFNRPSVGPFIRLIGIELLTLAALLVSGRFVLRRA